MTEVALPNEDEIRAALGRDARFSDPMVRSPFEATLYALPEIIGAERLAAKVTFAALLEVTVDVVEHLLATGFEVGCGLTVMSLNNGLVSLRQLVPQVEAVLKSSGLTDADVLLGPNSQLSDEDKDLFRADELTFAVLVRSNPGQFIPVS